MASATLLRLIGKLGLVGVIDPLVPLLARAWRRPGSVEWRAASTWVVMVGAIGNLIWAVQARSVPVFFGRGSPGRLEEIAGTD